MLDIEGKPFLEPTLPHEHTKHERREPIKGEVILGNFDPALGQVRETVLVPPAVIGVRVALIVIL